MSKVLFSGESSQIFVLSGITELDVQTDLYSEWKEWVLESDNSKYLQAFRTFGGDPTITGQFAPKYYFLTNGWRVVIDNGEVVSVGVNLYTDETTTPYIVGPGSGVSDRNSDAVIVDSSVDETLNYLGVVVVNQLNGVSGIEYPIGTTAQPVNNWTDAKIIAENRSIHNFTIFGTSLLDVDLHDATVFGGNITDIMVFQGVDVSGTTFNKVVLAGVSSGYYAAEVCQLYDGLSGAEGIFKDCGFMGNVYLGDSVDASFLNCSSLVSGEDSPHLFFNNQNNVSVRKYSGGLKIYDIVSGSTSTFEFLAGNIQFMSGCTGSHTHVRGIAKITDNTSGTTIESNGLVIPYEVGKQHSIDVLTEITKNK